MSKSSSATPGKPFDGALEHTLTLEELLQALLHAGLIERGQYNRLLGSAATHRQKGIHPLVSVAEMNWQSATTPSYALGLERLTKWLAEQVGLPYLHIDPLRTDFVHLTQYVSYAYAARFNILPVERKDNTLTVATAEPFVREWEPELKHALALDIRRVLASPLDVARYLKEFYALQHSIQGADSSGKFEPRSGLLNLEQLLELGKRDEEPDVGDQHVVHIVDWLLQYAFAQRASDIHLEPRRLKGRVRFRIDGLLHTVHEIPTPILGAITSRIKMLGRMNMAERRRPQDGRVKTVVPETGKHVELRLSTMPTAFGEKLVARIFDPEVLVKDFRQLGFSKRDVELWNKMAGQSHGIVLVTGPTGSGKTSTLYSTLKHLARPEINICTIEDPIEIVEPEFNQMQVNPGIGVDFAAGVRTLLRQDPDIIMVGEIRDRETAEMSIQAALTGHLVLSTLHTNDAPSAIPRLLDIGVPPYLINATLLGIVAQRLVRTLCPQCKQPAAPNPVEWQALVYPHTYRAPEKIYVPVGCDHCRHTGFRGRIGLFEIMHMDAGLENLITNSAGLGEIRAHALKSGWRPLRLSGAEKIATGITTFGEVFNTVTLVESGHV